MSQQVGRCTEGESLYLNPGLSQGKGLVSNKALLIVVQGTRRSTLKAWTFDRGVISSIRGEE